MSYERLAELMSKVRNARATTLVGHLEEVIENDLWRDYTAPNGTRFQFRSHEFDYFLAAEGHDPTEIRRHYAAADLPDMAHRQMRLADITGQGVEVSSGQRRSRKEIIEALAHDPSGSAGRVQAVERVVSRSTAEIAKDPPRRRAYLAGESVPRQLEWRFQVRTRDCASLAYRAQRIVEELGKDPDLAHAVLNGLRRRSYDESSKSAGQRTDAALHGNGAS